MSLLSLKGIGKIYASQNAVAVGIRGVNLDLNIGEFVAITGKSGSGKSTLLNVLSGMDTYEEGELYVEGNPTSHYTQEDWEEYRSKYISFIFQDYNIIESFTVLQNVELALGEIEDVRERKKKAMELLDKVGLHDAIHQKGSHLSGGQKQRTVIARALAKDSPIILADEPTGNLDSETSKEIIALLQEISKEKLVVVVTHDFEEVKDVATRHVRIYDGNVESDTKLKDKTNENITINVKTNENTKEVNKKNIRNGVRLGLAIFSSRPKLSTFLCLLLVVGILAVTIVTASMSLLINTEEQETMFYPKAGRLVVVRQDAQFMTEEELSSLQSKIGAISYLHYDELLDQENWLYLSRLEGINDKAFYFNFDKDYGIPTVGNYPQNDNELLLYLPIGYKTCFGTNVEDLGSITIYHTTFKVSGIKYYSDNNKAPEVRFTKKGFQVLTMMRKFDQYINGNVLIVHKDGFTKGIELTDIYVDMASTGNHAYFDYSYYGLNASMLQDTSLVVQIQLDNGSSFSFFNQMEITYDNCIDKTPSFSVPSGTIIMSADMILDMENQYYSKTYHQASFFFENDRQAEKQMDYLQDLGYVSALSTTESIKDSTTTILYSILKIYSVGQWIGIMFFIGFLIFICSSKSIASFRNEMAIMRSMGISVKEIKVGMYIRMLICMIPSLLVITSIGLLISYAPWCNRIFRYLYLWEYALIVVGILFITLWVTRRQIGKLFGASVRKALRGGDAL